MATGEGEDIDVCHLGAGLLANSSLRHCRLFAMVFIYTSCAMQADGVSSLFNLTYVFFVPSPNLSRANAMPSPPKRSMSSGIS